VRLAHAATRERILAAAAEVFQRGYRSTSLDEVAARLEITKPAIYHYFPSKEHLLCELYDRVVALSLRRMEEVFRAPTAPAVKLEAMLRIHIGLVVEQLPLFTIFFQEERSLPAGFRRKVLPNQRTYADMMVDVYREGAREGAFRDLDPAVVVNTLLATGNWLYRWYRPDGRLPAARIADIIVAVVSAGYLAHPTGEPAPTGRPDGSGLPATTGAARRPASRSPA
jgi:AcrR family transcriptional regulator